MLACGTDFNLSALHASRQPHHKLRELSFLSFHLDLAFMLLHDDVVADRQAQARALSRRFRGKKRTKNFLANVNRNAVVPQGEIADADFDLQMALFVGCFYLRQHDCYRCIADIFDIVSAHKIHPRSCTGFFISNKRFTVFEMHFQLAA